MSYNPCRRRGHTGAAGARARQVPVESHVGDRRAFLRRHAAEAAAAATGSPAARTGLAAKLLSRTADTRNLRLAWDHLAAGDGQAPGPDGLRYTDLSAEGVWALARALGRAIRSGTYRPGPDRKVQIPKGPGRGYRTLSIPSVPDRVVQRAAAQILQPVLDPLFDNHSFGFRSDRDVLSALATAERLAVDTGRWVWVLEDLRTAFDLVPQSVSSSSSGRASRTTG